MPELDEKVAIVTGAGRLRGVGRATAVHLARLGADVVVIGTGRNPQTFPPDEKEVGWKDVESTAEQVRVQGGRALSLTVDVANCEQIQVMVDRTLKEFGRIDILVNNAAFPRGPDRVPFIELDLDIFQRVQEVKVTGTYLCASAVAKIMIEQGQGGKIINVASVAGKHASPNMLAYNAANFAVIGMTQAMAKELGPHRINVNCICPGVLDTARTDDLGRGDLWQQMISNIPIGRVGTDEDIGAFTAFLCTEGGGVDSRAVH